MLDEHSANEQVRRLRSMKFFPADEIAARELVIVVMTAETFEIAQRAVGEFIYDSDQCPTPSDLRRAIDYANERYNEIRKKNEKKCPDCKGVGFISHWYLVTKHFDGEANWTTRQRIETEIQREQIQAHLTSRQEILEGAEPCHCHSIAQQEGAA